MACGNEMDVIAVEFKKGGKVALCKDCRTVSAKPLGRPSIGITRKVSLTLPEEDWKWFDEMADGNSSQFLRTLAIDKKEGENA